MLRVEIHQVFYGKYMLRVVLRVVTCCYVLRYAKSFFKICFLKTLLCYKSMEKGGILAYHQLDKTKETKYMQNVNNKTAC